MLFMKTELLREVNCQDPAAAERLRTKNVEEV